MPRTRITPGVGIGPFELGMTREQAWAQTRCRIVSYFSQAWSTERSDDFTELGIHAHCEQGKINRLVAFTSVQTIGQLPLELFDEDISGFARADVVALLEVHELPYVDGDEQIRVPSQGLIFGFTERHEQELLEYVVVEAAAG